MAEILYFAILKKDKKWKTKKEALQKEIGSLGKGPFNHNQEGGRGRPNHYAIT